MNDEKIIELFWERSQNALTELDLKYGKDCLILSKNIVKNLPDAEECVNDSYLGVWNSIPPKRPNALLAYVLKIVRNISIRRYHYNRAERRNVENTLPLDDLSTEVCGFEGQYTEQNITDILNDFLAGLDKKDRMLFVRRYWYSDSLESLSRKTGLKENNIAQKLYVMRGKLRMQLQKGGVDV